MEPARGPSDAGNAVEAIKQLKARYFRTMGTKDWQGMRDVFTADVAVDMTASGGRALTGADEFISLLRATVGDAVTVHHGHMPEIELTSPTTATGIWALQDVIIWPDGTRLLGYGHYHETYRLLDSQWRISSTVLTRLHMELSPRTGQQPDGQTAT
jgi:hypothetical protein